MNTDMYYYQKPFLRGCQEEDSCQKPNGDLLESNNLEVGFIMKYTSQNHLFCFLEDLWGQTQPQACHPHNQLLQEYKESDI